MWVLSLCLLAAASADKLSPSYQAAPDGAVGAGGEPGDLSAPFPPPGAAAGAAPEVIPIVSFSNTPNSGDGSYSFGYETGNGISAQEEGSQKEAPEGPGTAAQGAYSYTGPDGVVYTVVYTADENGFVPKGDHLPTPPPIPAEIQAALEQIAAAEAAEAAAGPAAPVTAAPPAPAAPAAQPAFYYKTVPNYNYNYYNYKQQAIKPYNNKNYNRYFRRY